MPADAVVQEDVAGQRAALVEAKVEAGSRRAGGQRDARILRAGGGGGGHFRMIGNAREVVRWRARGNLVRARQQRAEGVGAVAGGSPSSDRRQCQCWSCQSA